jgi:hypothetical protein
MKKINRQIRKYGGACLNAKSTESAYIIRRLKLAHADALLNQPYYRNQDMGPGIFQGPIPQRFLTTLSKELTSNAFSTSSLSPHFCCYACWGIDHWDSIDNYPKLVRDVHCKHCPGLSDYAQLTRILEHNSNHNGIIPYSRQAALVKV